MDRHGGVMSNRHHLLRSIVVAAATAPLAACVTSPIWGDEPTRRDPIDFTGVVSRASAPVRVQAWNHGTATFDTVRTFSASTTRLATSPDIYGWSTYGVSLADRYWVPPGASCRDGGMANLRVQEQATSGTWSDLATFDAAGEACLYDRIGDGEHPVAAGNACKRSQATIVLFAPPQCVIAPASDASAPVATIRLSDGARAWQTSSEAGAADVDAGRRPLPVALTAQALVRDRNGGVRRAELVGDTVVTCRFTDGTMTALPLPVTASTTQTVVPGAQVQIGLDATRAIDVARLTTSTCPAGSAFVGVSGTLFATGTNGAGATVTSRALRFRL